MKRGLSAALASAAALALAGCTSVEPQSRRVNFECENGPPLTVVFEGEQARIISGDEPPIVLPRRPTGSGFLYETPTRSIRGEGQTMTYTVGRMVPMQCREVGAVAR